MTFRTKIFLTALAAAAMAVLVATALVLWSVRRDLEQRIERQLATEARMAAAASAVRKILVLNVTKEPPGPRAGSRTA